MYNSKRFETVKNMRENKKISNAVQAAIGVLAVVLAALIAISRMYVFVHFPTDVLTGTILGIIEAILAGIIVRFIYRKMEEKKTKVA